MNWFLFSQCDLHDLFVEFFPNAFLVDSSASTMEAYFVLPASRVLQVSFYFLLLILQGMAAGIGTSNFFSAFPTVSLNSASAGSMKWIPRNLLELSSCGNSIVHFCFSFRCAASDMLSISLVTSNQAWMSFVSSSTAPPDHVHPSGGFSSNMVNRVNPVHESDRSRFPSTVQ